LQLKKSFIEFTSKFWWLTLAAYLLGALMLLQLATINIMVTGKMSDQEEELAAKKADLEKKLGAFKLNIGIQGGQGSFNELALNTFFDSNPAQSYKINYLHTTENVLTALDKGEIDRGQFAIRNTIGGEVQESVEAMKKHKFEIICQYDLKVAHTLMMSPKAKIEELNTVVAHPQALKQCKEHLKKYPHLKQFSGEGDLVDPSLWAKNLNKGKFALSHAILGNKRMAELNKLKIIQENMQDSEDNFTTFVLVKRIDATSN